MKLKHSHLAGALILSLSLPTAFAAAAPIDDAAHSTSNGNTQSINSLNKTWIMDTNNDQTYYGSRVFIKPNGTSTGYAEINATGNQEIAVDAAYGVNTTPESGFTPHVITYGLYTLDAGHNTWHTISNTNFKVTSIGYVSTTYGVYSSGTGSITTIGAPDQRYMTMEAQARSDASMSTTQNAVATSYSTGIYAENSGTNNIYIKSLNTNADSTTYNEGTGYGGKSYTTIKGISADTSGTNNIYANEIDLVGIADAQNAYNLANSGESTVTAYGIYGINNGTNNIHTDLIDVKDESRGNITSTSSLYGIYGASSSTTSLYGMTGDSINIHLTDDTNYWPGDPNAHMTGNIYAAYIDNAKLRIHSDVNVNFVPNTNGPNVKTFFNNAIISFSDDNTPAFYKYTSTTGTLQLAGNNIFNVHTNLADHKSNLLTFDKLSQDSSGTNSIVIHTDVSDWPGGNVGTIAGKTTIIKINSCKVDHTGLNNDIGVTKDNASATI